MTHTHRMTPLPAQYDQAATEKKWQHHWLEKRTYAWDPSIARADSYVIDTPPPTVSGTLHMGHVFSYTQADFIARFQRMNGKNVFYPMGFDDNGLPTERLVEKTKKIRAVDMSREAFIAECLSVSEEARAEFRAMFRSIALSVDWEQEYHTISDASRRLSQLSFIDLVNKGHVYRKQQPMLWDPVDQTAIAQAEVEDKELPSNFCDIAFTCAETGEQLIIGTTRPELIPACVALFYHPDDARYQHLKGKHATVPLCGFSVAILEDDAVEPEKGTGLMMCCTFGDEKDIEKWRKHNLPTRTIINKFGKIELTLALVEGQFETGFAYPHDLAEAINSKKVSNADVKHPGARQIILGLLETAGTLKAKKPITHAVKCAERSGAPLELIPTAQWFVQVTDKKESLKAKAKECEWNPDWMRIRIEQWIDGLNWDWCISRQRYFGVPFPVWYSKREGEIGKAIYATPDQLPVNPLVDVPAGYTREEVSPDLDVMDTWATSSISPQLSAHGITAETTNETARYESLFPADLRPQAHEIIRTWAFYTLVKSHLHSDCIPWKNLMISGWCLAEDKSKMSKSKGNVVTPTALIEEKGTDAVRYWAGTSRLGQDTAFSPDLLKIGKKLVGKLWNATQFAAIHLNKLEAAPQTAAIDMESGVISEVMDRWILSRLAQTIHASTAAFSRYEYADALDASNSFFWADFCDNYLELIKKRVYNEDGSASPATQQSAVRTLYYVLDGILKLYAPFVPHVTEELYSHIFADNYEQYGSLHARATWPQQQHYAIDDNALELGTQALVVLGLIRSEKSSTNRSIKFPIDILRISPTRDAEKWMADVAGAGNVRTWEVSAHLAADQTEIVFATEADAA
jgi:valyl-tRNA synthetase